MPGFATARSCSCLPRPSRHSLVSSQASCTSVNFMKIRDVQPFPQETQLLYHNCQRHPFIYEWKRPLITAAHQSFLVGSLPQRFCKSCYTCPSLKPAPPLPNVLPETTNSMQMGARVAALCNTIDRCFSQERNVVRCGVCVATFCNTNNRSL